MRINDKENYDLIRNSISMKNLGKIMASRDYKITKLAVNSKISLYNSFLYGRSEDSITSNFN